MSDPLPTSDPIDSKNESQLNRIRRLKACKHCHSLKVRCTPVDKNDPYSPCVRCINANKVCEIDSVEIRKKRKRSPRQELELVAQLKDQINELKSQLKQRELNSNSPAPSPWGSGQPQAFPVHANSPLSAASDTSSPLYITRNDLEKELSTLSEADASLKDILDHLRTFTEIRHDRFFKNKIIDVVSLKLISIEEARERLTVYQEVLYKLHPGIYVPPNLTVEDLIRDQPYLFNCIMLATSIVYKNQDVETSLALENQASSAVVNEILVSGSKSLQLVKCLILLAVWYNSPECFKLRRYHVYVSIGMSILHDMGYVKKPVDDKKKSDVDSDDQDPEYRVLVLTLYLCSVSFSLILRRTIHVKWTTNVEECCAFLENCDEPSYRKLAYFLRLHRELERIYHLLHSSEAVGGTTKVSEYAFNELKTGLAILRPRISDDDHTTLAFYYSVEAFLYQPLFEDLRIKPGFKNGKQCLSLRTLDSISHCTESCFRALGEFNKLSDERIACLPLIHFSRVVYTAGILLRLRYFIIASPFHVERELVPRHAVFAILTLNKRVQATSKLYPANFFLQKMMLILLLFINTYVSQTTELLMKDESYASQLAPILKRDKTELGYLANTILEPTRAPLKGTDVSPCLHLELLSYAATEYRESKEAPSNKAASSVKVEQNGSELSSANSIGSSVSLDSYPAPRTPKLPPFLSSSDALRRYSFGKPPVMSPATGYRNSSSAVPILPDPQLAISTNFGNSGLPNPTENPVLGMFDNDINDRRNSVLHIDDEFWSNLLGTNADTFYFAQDMPVHTENVL